MKTKQIRDLAFTAHHYIGLAIGLLTVPIGLTGSLLIIYGWLHTPASITPTGTRLPLIKLIEIARQAQPQANLAVINIPKELNEPISAEWLDASEKFTSAHFNPYTGAILSPLQSNDTTSWLYEIHIKLLGGEWGRYVVGIVGLLATILCITGIILWPGWRRLKAGFTIKWDAKIKRLNFDLHKVAGIVAAVFLAMAMFTGFVWNYGEWMKPAIYALTLSPQPVEAAEPVSKPIANQPPLAITAKLLETASAALPPGHINWIRLPNKPEETISLRKTIGDKDFSVYVDRYSGKVIRVDKPAEKISLGDRVYESFPPVHFGSFAGIYSRILYVFVGLSPTILLVTGFIMWQNRRVVKSRSIGASVKS